ncbi:patched domain-containing protein 3-like [Prorops nasuta]|uniref:patched domain-containing protein 3-like n=1 Tax=Prorops nasuta TaxID=863751 RepID=UPI0034CF8564
MEIDERIQKKSFLTLLYRVPNHISQKVEHVFYILGSRIAQQPRNYLLGSLLVILICLSGLFFFRQEKNPLKLWIPPDSDFVRDTEWLLSQFGEGARLENMIFMGQDILEPDALVKLNELTQKIVSLETNTEPKVKWSDVCLKVPVISNEMPRPKRQANFVDDFFDEAPADKGNISIFDMAVHADPELYCSIVNSLPKTCLIFSILDLWKYDSEEIKRQSKQDIIDKIYDTKISPTLGHPMNYIEILGGINRDENGKIISAKAVRTQWMLHVNFSDIDMDKLGNDAGTADWATENVLRWEEAYLKLLKSLKENLVTSSCNNRSLNIYYEAGRSFGDISSSVLFQEIDKLIAGTFLMFLYVLAILSNFNWVECRFVLTATGLLCVGGAFIIAIGVCSIIGIPYGPVHTSLPFMLLGLGIDDIFVMNASWKQIHWQELNRKKPLHERVGLTLGHAGSAICITSLTDVVAFIIGASTILPTLQSFCIYAAVGVLVTFLLQITFFIACYALDAKRMENKRNGIVPCVIHEEYEFNIYDPTQSVSAKFIHKLYSKVILTIPGKIIVILITLAIITSSIVGTLQLQQWFDPIWFIPKGTYFSDFISMRKEMFHTRGHSASAFIGNVDYPLEFQKILNLTSLLKNNTEYIESVDDWPDEFANFVTKFFKEDFTASTVDHDKFQLYLSKFLFSVYGGKYQKNFKFEKPLICGQNAPNILISSIDVSFKLFSGPHQWIPAMDTTKQIVQETGIDGFVTVWSKMFGSWETDKLIAQEVLRNILLALLCVMGMTAVLIAEFQTCFWILFCVLLTLLDVCGFMFFWGLSIDIVSCIGLELAVGLSVDYAAHVAHAFLNANSTKSGQEGRTERILISMRHIGAAVAYGAGSTLLALSMLAFSDAYVFQSFFKIFLLVILFGLWHGLILLPVILSTIGPRSLHRMQKHPQGSVEDAINETIVPLKKKKKKKEETKVAEED